jgi:tRNA(adenine34) deaminase
MNDEWHMQRCLDLAKQSLANGEVPVGAIVVKEEQTIGEGCERTRELLDLSAHAEVQAILAASQKLRSVDLTGCTLYSTVEPCVLCGYVIRRSGIRRVVFGIPTGQAGACTSQYAVLKDTSLGGWPQPPEVTSGVLATDCEDLMRAFSQRQKR